MKWKRLQTNERRTQWGRADDHSTGRGPSSAHNLGVIGFRGDRFLVIYTAVPLLAKQASENDAMVMTAYLERLMIKNA